MPSEHQRAVTFARAHVIIADGNGSDGIVYGHGLTKNYYVSDLLAAYDALCRERDALLADKARLERESEELRGVVETYGRVTLGRGIDEEVLQLNWRISRSVLRAARHTAVFDHAVASCKQQLQAHIEDAYPESTMEKAAEAFSMAFADAARTAEAPTDD